MKSQVALLNTSIITAEGSYTYRKIPLAEAKEILAGSEILSAIGHASTAQIMSSLLGIEVPVNRIQYEQQPNATALVFKLKGRPEEGRVLSIEEIETIGYEWGELKRVEQW